MPYPPADPANNKTNDTATVNDHPAHHNSLADAVIDLVDELGTNPSGTDPDVTTRLANHDSNANAHHNKSHDVLHADHADTTAASVARGDLITGQGASPKWVRLAKGAAGAILASDGTDVAWVAGEYRLKSVTYITSSITYNTPAGIKALLVEGYGAGGGGGGAVQTATDAGTGGGGGAGSYARKLITNPAASYAATIGVGGAGGAAGANNGSDGGTTSFGSVISCPGGKGAGTQAGAAAQIGNTAGAASNLPDGGDINVRGPQGNHGIMLGTLLSQVRGGTGAHGFLGSGGTGGGGGVDGGGGLGVGAGGGGGAAHAASANKAGGAGAPGLIVVYEYA